MLAGAVEVRKASPGSISPSALAQRLDLALELFLPGIHDRTGADVFERAHLARRGARLLEERAALGRRLVELVEFLPVLAPLDQRHERAGLARLESRQAVVDERDPVAALGELAFVDEVDSGLALQPDDVRHLLLQTGQVRPRVGPDFVGRRECTRRAW